MTEIVFLSGKGGTGKTSFTASFAVLAGNDGVIADCDVDAANMHLLLKPNFATSYDFYSGELAEIHHDSCTLCGKCAAVCRFNAVSFNNKQFHISSLDCEGCGYCEKVCPTQAITMNQRKSGRVFISETKVGNTMVHARLDNGAENSGKLVAKVKNEAKAIAASQNKSFILVDGSPGIGCPVVSSLSGANYVIFVTEPTMSGLHDLKRAITVVKKFRIPAGCIINKSDLNPENVSEIKIYLKQEHIDHLADIGYDIAFTTAMVEGKTVVEIESHLKESIENIWKNIKQKFNN